MCYMKKTNVRNLHLNTSSIVRDVAEGETYVVEKRGVAVAELRPVQLNQSGRQLPDRERLLSKFPRIELDSGRLLEEDRP